MFNTLWLDLNSDEDYGILSPQVFAGDIHDNYIIMLNNNKVLTNTAPYEYIVKQLEGLRRFAIDNCINMYSFVDIKIRPRLLSVAEVQQYLNIGRSKAYKMMQNKELPVVTIGQKLFVDVNDLNSYIEEHKEHK